VPPRVDYELTDRARDLLPVVGALARWGYRWVWGAPRPEEAVDVGAILRCAPGLVAPPGPTGSVWVVVTRGGGHPDAHHVLRLEGRAVAYEDGPDDRADARVAGAEGAWVDALGPESSAAGLTVTGDAALADRVLGFLAAVAVQDAAVA
jgi:hypothetical protein